MIGAAMPVKKWINEVVVSILARTRSYFDEEFGIAVAETDPDQNIGKIETLDIHGLTAVVGVGGPVSLLIAFSFEQHLVDALYARMTAEIEVPPGEEEQYRGSVAAEIINTIIGNCTADLQQSDQAISLTPPMILDHVKHIHRMQNVVFISRSLETDYGCVDINLVGPGELFDTSLNYVK
jgi:CheY-specific phosphatase CheX